MTSSGFGLFGTGMRTKALVCICLLEETHASELARILGAGITTIRNVIDTLEQAGVVAGVKEGGSRRIRLDTRFRAYDELKALLQKMALSDPALLFALGNERRRPRRSGKEI